MPRFELVERAGLHHVVVGSEVEDPDPLLLLTAPGEDDHRHAAVAS